MAKQLIGCRVVRTSDVLSKVVTSCDIRTSSTLSQGKSPIVQRMGEFCTLRVADGRSDRWKSARSSASPSAGRRPGHWHSRPPGGQQFFPSGRPPTRPHAGQRRPSLWASAPASALATAWRSTQEKQPSAWPSALTVPMVDSSLRPTGRPLAICRADRTADGLLRPPAIHSTHLNPLCIFYFCFYVDIKANKKK